MILWIPSATPARASPLSGWIEFLVMSRPEQLSLFEVPADASPARVPPEPPLLRPERSQPPEPIDGDEPTTATAFDGEAEPVALRDRLHERLDRLLGGDLAELVLTDNRTVLVSGRPADPEGWAVRLHWSFALAPAEVVAAVAAVVAGPRRGTARRRARQSVRNWISHFREATGPGPAPEAWAAVLDTRRREAATGGRTGHVHDLEEIRDEVNERYFGGRLPVDIAWSRAGRAQAARRTGRQRGRSTLKLGSWSEEDALVRIHPVLDHASVPRYVVASVVHHELLHAELGSKVRNGRRRHHTPEFRRREQEFAEHEEARRWIRDKLNELLKRRGKRSG